MAAPGQDDKPPAYSPPVGGYGSQPPPSGQYNQQYNQQYPGYPGSYQGGAPAMYQPTPGQLPSYMQGSATTVTVTQQPSVVIVGGCPACRVGVLEDDFTCLGVCCAIFFFPLGILCCLAMRQRRCPNCGAIFS